MAPEKAMTVILATCVLHNFMRDHNIALYTPPGYSDSFTPDGDIVDGTWRLDGNAYTEQVNNNRQFTQEATAVRDELKTYFCGPGSVEWQLAHVRRAC